MECPPARRSTISARPFQEAVADALTRKLALAVKRQRAKTVVICGGVPRTRACARLRMNA